MHAGFGSARLAASAWLRRHGRGGRPHDGSCVDVQPLLWRQQRPLCSAAAGPAARRAGGRGKEEQCPPATTPNDNRGTCRPLSGGEHERGGASDRRPVGRGYARAQGLRAGRGGWLSDAGDAGFVGGAGEGKLSWSVVAKGRSGGLPAAERGLVAHSPHPCSLPLVSCR